MGEKMEEKEKKMLRIGWKQVLLVVVVGVMLFGNYGKEQEKVKKWVKKEWEGVTAQSTRREKSKREKKER